MIVALGKIVVEMTEEEFNKLAVAKNKRDLVEAKEDIDSGIVHDDEWGKANNAYCAVYKQLLESRKPISTFEEQLFI